MRALRRSLFMYVIMMKIFINMAVMNMVPIVMLLMMMENIRTLAMMINMAI